MRQAIITKFHGPTNTKGARISATSQVGRKYHGWDYALNPADNHRAAAVAFAKHWGWPVDNMVGGAMPNGDGYCWVFAD